MHAVSRQAAGGNSCRLPATLCQRKVLASNRTLPHPPPPAAAVLQVASLIGADAKEIIFTSGATESNNLAVKGVANFYKDKKRHIITSQTEHKCVLDSAR